MRKQKITIQANKEQIERIKRVELYYLICEELKRRNAKLYSEILNGLDLVDM